MGVACIKEKKGKLGCGVERKVAVADKKLQLNQKNICSDNCMTSVCYC